ncbi:MAG: hypothetical protein ABIK28_13405 [Planctomycetota bacterium]
MNSSTSKVLFRCISSVAFLLLVAGLTSPAFSQAGGGMGGFWSGSNPPALDYTIRLYVDPSSPSAVTGVPVPATPTIPYTGPGSAFQPYTTITYAVSQAIVLLNHPTNTYRVTINVKPGTYPDWIETYPISLPARGLSIDAYMAQASVGVNLVGSGPLFTQGIFSVDQPGPAGAPHTVIQGFSLRGTNTAILIDPSILGSTPPGAPDAVRVRHCHIENNNNAVVINNSTGWKSEHVIEDCFIGSNFNTNISVQNAGTGLSSTLIRSNKFYDVPNYHIVVNGNPSALENTKPRIVSNMVYAANTGPGENIRVSNAAPWIVNNTVADHQLSGSKGVVLNNTHSSTMVANNILWLTNNSSGGSMEDLVLQAGAQATIVYNDIQDGNYTGNNNFSADPLFVNQAGFDLHITANSPCKEYIPVGAANIGLGIWYLQVGTGSNIMTVRRDLARDVDWDPRAIDYTDAVGVMMVDVGADELHKCRMSLTTPGSVDTFFKYNTMYDNNTTPTPVTFTLTGPPNHLFQIYVWFNFTTDPIYENYVLLPDFGNLMFSLNTPDYFPLTLPVPCVFDPAGNFSYSTAFPNFPLVQMEWEYYLQALSFAPDFSRGATSNIVRLEVKF